MKKKSFLFENVVIIGLGLMGGSFALEIKKKKLAQKVIGISRSRQNRNLALKTKAVDLVYPQLGSFIKEADLIVLATPVESILPLLKKIKPWISSQALVTDVGSTKLNIVRGAQKLGLRQFVGGHPIAGTEKSGMTAAELALFKNKKWILTPVNKNKSLRKFELLLKKIDAEPHYMKADEHDEILATVSHLPNVIAYALANSVGAKNRKKNIQIAGSSLKGMTRVTSSPPEMWRDICLANAAEISKSLLQFQKHLNEFQKAIRAKNGKKLEMLFKSGNKFRKELDQKNKS